MPFSPAKLTSKLQTSNTSSCKLCGIFCEKVEIKLSMNVKNSFFTRERALLNRNDLISEKTTMRN